MGQQMGLTFTFARDGFTPSQYLDETHDDLIEVMWFRETWSLAAKIEDIARKYQFPHKDGCYVIEKQYGLLFLKETLFTLRDEIKKIDTISCDGIYTTASMDAYRHMIEVNIGDLEWLLFYYTGRIATSEFILCLSEDCYLGLSERKHWIEMCKNWGNEPTEFKLIFWIR